MALSRLLACVSPARPTDILAVPAMPTSARTVAPAALATLLMIWCMRSSSIWPAEIALRRVVELHLLRETIKQRQLVLGVKGATQRGRPHKSSVVRLAARPRSLLAPVSSASDRQAPCQTALSRIRVKSTKPGSNSCHRHSSDLLPDL